MPNIKHFKLKYPTKKMDIYLLGNVVGYRYALTAHIDMDLVPDEFTDGIQTLLSNMEESEMRTKMISPPIIQRETNELRCQCGHKLAECNGDTIYIKDRKCKTFTVIRFKDGEFKVIASDLTKR